jgi:5-methylcytosine-specific restriction protein A
MPTRAPIFRPAGQQSRQEQKREFDRFRRKAKSWRRFYGTPEWQALRTTQLIAQPYCERCKPKGYVVRATVVHHKTPHRGDWQLFVSSELESLCKRCHDTEAQAEEAAADRQGEGA